MFEELESLANRYKTSEVREEKVAAAILFDMLGAKTSHRLEDLMHHITPFTEGNIRRLTAHRN